jgi:glycosyltransferase involved in cell wall biosynthesis
MPKVSIILPTHNGSKWISGAINSVINQSFSDWELIIIDDCSDDDTDNIIKYFSEKYARIRHLRNEKNIGLSKSLNKGICNARGEFIARIDDDDVWICADKLARQVNFLNENPKCVLVGTNMIAIDEGGNEVGHYSFPVSDAEIRNKFLSVNCFAHSSVMFRKDVVIRAGGYPILAAGEDYDLWLKLGTLGELANIDKYCLRYLIRQNSKSSKSSGNKIQQSLIGIRLAKKYRNDYPHFLSTIIARYFGTVKYWFLNFIPFSCKLALTRLKFRIKEKIK